MTTRKHLSDADAGLTDPGRTDAGLTDAERSGAGTPAVPDAATPADRATTAAGPAAPKPLNAESDPEPLDTVAPTGAASERPAERDARPVRRSAAARLYERLGRPGPTLIGSYLVLAVVVIWAFLPGLFAPYDPIAGDAAVALQPPSADHLFGTDATGRDMFSRVVHGAIHSLSGALIAVSVGFVLGTALGILAGSIGGILDDVLMRIVDVLLAIPSLLLSLSIIIILGFGTTQAAFAVGITSVAAFARLARSEVVRVRGTDYVEAAFASGGRFLPVLARHVLPNSLTAVFALAALQFGTAVLAISTLGFLGYGAPPPTPEWGLMIAEGRDYVATSWWLTLLPGLVVVLVVMSANRISASIAKKGRIE